MRRRNHYRIEGQVRASVVAAVRADSANVVIRKPTTIAYPPIKACLSALIGQGRMCVVVAQPRGGSMEARKATHRCDASDGPIAAEL